MGSTFKEAILGGNGSREPTVHSMIVQHSSRAGIM